MVKAFGWMKRVVKSDYFSRKRPFLHHTCATFSELPTYISTMGSAEFRPRRSKNWPKRKKDIFCYEKKGCFRTFGSKMKKALKEPHLGSYCRQMFTLYPVGLPQWNSQNTYTKKCYELNCLMPIFSLIIFFIYSALQNI